LYFSENEILTLHFTRMTVLLNHKYFQIFK